MARLHVTMRYIAMAEKPGCYMVYDAEQRSWERYRCLSRIGAWCRAYRLNRARCVNCLDAIKDLPMDEG
jgi:hypothetical protein